MTYVYYCRYILKALTTYIEYIVPRSFQHKVDYDVLSDKQRETTRLTRKVCMYVL